MYLTGGRLTYIIKFFGTVVLLFILHGALFAKQTNPYSVLNPPPADTTGLRYSFDDEPVYSPQYQKSPLYLNEPSNVVTHVEYDPKTNRYIISEKVGDVDYKPPVSMSAEEYSEYEKKHLIQNYWVQKRNEESGAGPSFMKDIHLGGEALTTVFGTDAINIKPRGSAELIFGYSVSRTDNPNLPIRNRRTGSFTFKEKINMDVTGTIGDKMELGLNYNTEASFNFENKTKLEYTGKEDEIIKKIEAGDVTFSLPGSLITGSQSLFGLKSELQFGKLTVTTVMSHQRGESSSIEVQGGAQLTDYEIEVDEYDENRHFFLSHFFRDNYNKWLKNLPHIESQLQIQQIEVWVVNKQNDFTEARNVVALMDLAEGYNPDQEPNFYADNGLILANSADYNQPSNNLLNKLYQRLASQPGIRRLSTVNSAISGATSGYDFESGRDYVILESARPLSEREYSVNRELGYISLNSPLRNDEVLAVAFVYTYRGKTYKVGELASESSHPDVLILKLLKGITQTPRYPTWDLMMKNIYSIGAFQVSRDGFVLDVLYRNDKTGKPVNYLSEPPGTISDQVNEKILLKVLDLDNLDSRNEPNPDGLFDFIEGVTINSRNGRVIFPLVEPFGKDLRNKITYGHENDPVYNKTADKYVFEELYDSTHTKAEQIAEKNKFLLKGRYQSASSSDIQLNAMNIPQGSVKVTAGGIQLVENQDYTVDYTLGRVKILNQGLLESGTPIRISLESNSLFNLQTKTLLGTHLDYRFSDNFNVGATIMNLTERPITEKSNIGDVPISNTIWGLNTSYRTESQLLTSLVDKIPLIETKEVSTIALDAEFAHLIPGQAHTENNSGVAFIDDFEGAQTKIELKNVTAWKLCSAPYGQPGLFPYANQDGLVSGYGRAKLAWYIIDPLFTSQQSKSLRPDGIDVENNYVRRVDEKELFPQRDASYGLEPTISVLNLAYYPSERGPYNFDPSLTENGRLPNPESRWGGIMREIQTSDFETSNVEFIEFWLMDPYSYNSDHQGGDLYIQLGEISEDILRDSRKSYEDGLPGVNEEGQLDSTVWGKVPRGTSLVNAFDTDPENRIAQDVGLDGLNDADEQTYFSDYLNSLSPGARNYVINDPSGDDFKYYLGEDLYPVSSTSILYRYKNYNGMEGNSPAITDPNAKYIPSNQTTPDVEDINRDNTLNSTETYYQYHVSLRPEDLALVGNNYITDKVEVAGNDGSDSVKWYQFRIPIGDFESKIGQIEDFKSIRFMRMVLDNFADSVVLRFATLELVRGEWRRYNLDFNDAGPSVSQQHSGTDFEISAVNIEENITKTPVNYILPPGVNRDTDPSQQTTVYLNEQSLLLKVKDLQDYDARTVFKNTQLDLRQYKNLKMFIHAEALTGSDLEDYELTAFIRMGSDYKDNYYEYEVPLKVTLPENYNPNSESDKYLVWPAANFIDLSLEDLVELKRERNEAIQNDPLRYSTQKVYRRNVDKSVDEAEDRNAPPNVMKVKGNPNLENVRQIMIGIRNPGDGTSAIVNDGLPKSGEVWFNELRLTDFDNKGGWAANGRVQANLADFGVVKMAGSTSKPGFGSIDQTVEQRSKEEINEYDVSTNLELGKFFPEKANVSVPMYVGVSKSVINPEYYPGDPDVKFKDVLRDAESKAEKDSLKKISQDLTRRSSINFTNVRWNKELKKFKPLSPGNFTFGAGHSLTESHNYNVEYNNFRRYNATFNYNLNLRSKPFQPFRKSKSLRKPYLRLIRDFNVNYYPSRFSFSTQFDRNYQEMKMRNVFTDVELKIDSTVNKDFTWNRLYTLNWDFTRSLKFDYSAQNYARIDEPAGAYDLFKPDNERWKDSVWHNILNGGRNMQFNQNVNLQYIIPINKIPAFNWVSASSSYNGTYNWTRGDVLVDRERDLGNTIKNSNSIKFTGNLNMKNLFYKVGYLKKLDQKYSGRKKKSDENQRYKTVEYSKRTFFKKDIPKNFFHRLGTEDVTVKVLDKSNNEVDVKVDVINENKISITAPEDITGVEVKVEGKIERGENPLVYIGENSIRFLTGVRSVNISWTKSNGTMLPGYLPGTNYFGINNEQYSGAPGVPFVLGWSDNDFAKEAALKGWLTTDSTFSKPVIMTSSDQVNLRTTFEPFNGFRIDLTAFRSYSETSEQIYYYDNVNGNYGNHYFDNEYLGGNFSISVITIGTAFEKINADNNWKSNAFEEFKQNRKIISARRHSIKTGEDFYFTSLMQATEEGYYDGYGSTSSEVLIPAFLSAYTGRDPRKITFEQFPWNMMPNWRITVNKLDDIKALKKIFKNITLTHSYKSTYSIGSFSSNLAYFEEGSDGIRGFLRDNQMNFIPQYQIYSATINEQLSPLMSIDMTWQNSLLTKFELRKSRILSLSLNNNQLTETRNNDIVIGAGYRFKEVPLPIEGRDISSDLDLRFDFSIRDNITIIRSLAQSPEDEREEPTTGDKRFAISLTADYVISDNLNIQLYFDRNVRTPYTSRSFLTAETNIGFSLRFSL